jgi:hypothetical protein
VSAAASETNVWIPMSDGLRLAATLYLPVAEGPWPVVMEARPYRKDDTSYSAPIYRRLRDEGGYAVCRIDVRGTGSSEGIPEDEYPPQEQRDLCEVIGWLADQEWCTGAVGMYGTSYSGFNSLQVAAEQPPALKAIIPIYASDARYTDDVHYGGGIRRALDFLDYPLLMVAMNALPPVPSVFGEGWREEWRRRVESSEPWLLRWIEEQDDGPYWRHGSVLPVADRITAATMIIAGWTDGYHNATFRLFERLGGPKRMLLGPWSHMAPRTSLPGPRIDHVPEMIRWWDRWLKGTENGVDDEPVVAFMRRPTRPEPDLDAYRGEWRIETQWPPERLRRDRRLLGEATSPGRITTDADDTLEVRPDVGFTGSIWCAAQLPFGTPMDQRPDEAYSLVYDWGPLREEVEILGYPEVEAVVSCSTPVAFLSAKLCDVSPDGTSSLVSRAVLNLTHRDSHERPAPMEPGVPTRVTVQLDATSWVFEPGHRIRLDLAGADWPSTWAPPQAGTLTVDRGSSALVLPVLDPPHPDRRPSFAPGTERAETPEPIPTWRIERDVLSRETRVHIDQSADHDVETGAHVVAWYDGETGVSVRDPSRAWSTGEVTYRVTWPDVDARARAVGTLRSDGERWHLELRLDVSEGEAVWAERKWERSFPRHLQ